MEYRIERRITNFEFHGWFWKDYTNSFIAFSVIKLPTQTRVQFIDNMGNHHNLRTYSGKYGNYFCFRGSNYYYKTVYEV